MGVRHLSNLLLLPVVLLVVACARIAPGDGPALDVEATSSAAAVASLPAAEEATALSASSTPRATATAGPPTTQIPSETATPPPTPTTRPTLTPTAVPDVMKVLRQAEPPVRDDARLAAAYLGAELDDDLAAATPVAWEVGATDRFFVGNIDANTVEEITAELLHVSDRAYFWFDTGKPEMPVDPALLAEAAAEFDMIYEQVSGYFAAEGSMSDEQVHIVHVSPLSLCSVTLTTTDLCRLAGYFSPRDLLPLAVNPRTNGREMFVMNATQFGRTSYLDVLAHELRHMIEARYDLGDEDWAVEGSAMLAAELAGHEAAAQGRANLFLTQPDRQLNSWSETDSLFHYGQGYLFSRYLFDRLGPALYRELAISPASGLRAIDRLAQANGALWSSLSLWLDWLVTMVAGSTAPVSSPYAWQGPSLDDVTAVAFDAFPSIVNDTVSQWAADYYVLEPGAPLALTFAGEPEVMLLSSLPHQGETVWYALRDNYANPRLTRTIDLRGVESATLEYAVFADIEEGYDFAYVSVSTDGGAAWQPLVAAGMRGEDATDDPSSSALADRFYTGRSEGWLEEVIDLTQFAGQEIQLRFEYITDPVLTYHGFALDEIAVPEIGLFDDAESEIEGWTAEGFVRAPGRLAQSWHVLLVTPGEIGPDVAVLSVSEDGRLETDLSWDVSEPAVLIVAATAPRTLTPATYELTLERVE